MSVAVETIDPVIAFSHFPVIYKYNIMNHHHLIIVAQSFHYSIK